MTVEIGQMGKLFNRAEARALLPLVRAITHSAQSELKPIQEKLNRMLSNDPRRSAIEKDYQEIVSRWKEKVEKLGPKVNGLWVVEFDVGEGFISWKHPEYGLNFFRPHDTPFAMRVRLSQYIEETDPDWA